MGQIRQFESVAQARLEARPLHLAIGIFDGVHLGHRAVIEPAVRAARAKNGIAAVLTFAPHPSVVLRPEQPTRLLMMPGAKASVMAELGVDVLVTEPFTAAFAGLAAEEFLPWLLKHWPQLKAVYVGENWRFGRGRRGDLPLLSAEGARLGVQVLGAARVQATGEPISSSRIRALLTEGAVERANALLGYAYFSEGVVLAGKRLGRTIGFPTLNLAWAPELRPALGVYAVQVSGTKSARPLPGVANYGLRPTVENSVEPKLEIHLLEDCPYDAGDTIRVEWRHFIRPERKFAGVAELRQQIARDVEVAGAWFQS